MDFKELVRPSSGVMSCRIFENDEIGLLPSLFFDIEIELLPFEFGGSLEATSVRLEFIDFKIRRPEDLSNAVFAFPTNPVEGYIDGSIYLGHAHNPADATRIAFGAFTESTVVSEIDIQFDFTIERVSSEFGKPRVTWRVPIRFERSKLETVFAEARSSIWC